MKFLPGLPDLTFVILFTQSKQPKEKPDVKFQKLEGISVKSELCFPASEGIRRASQSSP
jgi:hypothetical protein